MPVTMRVRVRVRVRACADTKTTPSGASLTILVEGGACFLVKKEIMKRSVSPTVLSTATHKKKWVAWDETELITGVCRSSTFNHYNVSLGKGETVCVTGLEKALTLRESYTCIQCLIAQLESDKTRVQHNSALKRAFAERLRIAFELFAWGVCEPSELASRQRKMRLLARACVLV